MANKMVLPKKVFLLLAILSRQLFAQELDIYELMNSIANVSSYNRKVIPNWYNYTYDVGLYSSYINDGGFDMFDTGNEIQYGNIANYLSRATYNQKYDGPGYEFATRSIHPFTALMLINGQTSSTLESYIITASGNAGIYGGGVFLTFPLRSISYLDFNISYSSVQIFGTSRPTICLLYFYMSSAVRWNSVEAEQIEFSPGHQSTNRYITQIKVSGKPKRVLLGYMLLSRHTSGENSEFVSQSKLVQVLLAVATSFTSKHFSST